MKNNLQISIPNPCSENWNEMQPKDCGRFCQSCQKTVTDFTMMTDEAFIAHFQNTKTLSCGRFTERQLAIEIPVKSAPLLPFRKMSKYVAASMIVAAGSSGKVFGQKVEVEQLSNASEKIEEKESFKSSDEIEIIRGKVIDEQENGIPGFIVTIKGLNIQTSTDIDGNFELSITKNPKIIFYDLIISSTYDTFKVTKKINIYKNDQIEIIKLRLNTPQVIVGDVEIYRPTKWNRFKKWIKNNFL